MIIESAGQSAPAADQLRAASSRSTLRLPLSHLAFNATSNKCVFKATPPITVPQATRKRSLIMVAIRPLQVNESVLPAIKREVSNAFSRCQLEQS
ncbi:hypothetical protein V5O39_10840 [Pseudomonas parakoreensis]